MLTATQLQWSRTSLNAALTTKALLRLFHNNHAMDDLLRQPWPAEWQWSFKQTNKKDFIEMLIHSAVSLRRLIQFYMYVCPFLDYFPLWFIMGY